MFHSPGRGAAEGRCNLFGRGRTRGPSSTVTKGIEAAAAYIAGVFEGAGLKPAPGANGYFQPFTISGRPTIAGKPELALVGPGGKELKGVFKTDFSPLALGTGGSLDNVPIVFAGYGITAKDEARKLDYDDYAGINVKGKAVLLIPPLNRSREMKPVRSMARKPAPMRRFSTRRPTRFSTAPSPLSLSTTRPAWPAKRISCSRFSTGGRSTDVNSNLPFVMLTRELGMDKLLAEAGEPAAAQLEQDIDSGLKPRSRPIKGWGLTERIVIERSGTETKNVVGVLEGAGPLADETVVIGGHYDHLGHGGMGSGSMAIFSRDIHNGADDNASGTAMVLELARRLGARRDPMPRRVVFIAFSGEERGLLGSLYYVAHPLFPLSSTVMMVNFDMVGRLNAKNELTMIGTGTTPGIDALVDVLGKSAGLTIKKVSGMTDGFGGSDHQSFYGKQVPVLFAFTGIHADYHRPSDDTDLINFPGMARIADYLELITLDVVRRPERPTYIALKAPRPMPRHTASAGGGGSVAALRVVADYGYEGNNGVSVSKVIEGGPAAQAGMKDGDLITKLGNKPIGTMGDYMESLSKHKPGEKVEVVVKRDGKDVKLQVTLGSRPGE